MSRARSLPPKRRPRSARHAEPARPPRVRVIVADSQAIARGGLVGLIDDERDLEVVGEAATLEETVRQCTALDPDVLVLALNLARQEERPALPAILAALPKLKVLALAERSSAHCLVLNPPSRRARAGEKVPTCAIGTDCLTTMRRTADPEELFRAIRAVASGSAWYDSATAASLRAPGANDKGRSSARQKLTGRELEVAALIADGRSNKEISSLLTISEATVKKHVGAILAKLRLEDRLQAGLYLARNPLMFRRA